MKYILAVFLLMQMSGIQYILGQADRFSIGSVLGLNFASLPYEQTINSDEQNKHNNGINTGVFCNAIINSQFNIKIEMLYSVNGSFIYPEFFPKIDYGKIKLRHIEVPFHLDFYINSFKLTNFLPDWSFEIGGAYTKLFNYYIEDVDENNVTEQIKYNYNDALLIQAGTTIYFAKHFGANLRYSLPLLPSKKKVILSNSIRLIYRL